MDAKEWFWRYYDDLETYEHDYEWYDRLPKVTLSASTGTVQKASIPVLKQRSYTGKKPVIPSTLAGTLCSDLGIQGLLEKESTPLSARRTLSSQGGFTPFLRTVF